MEKEYAILEQKLKGLTESVQDICKTESAVFDVLTQMQEAIKNIQLQAYQQDVILNNLKYEILDPRNKIQEILFPHIESQEVLIEKIVQEGYSLARFGDGEFSIMENMERQKFQHLDDKLAQRLKEVILEKQERLLIGIADNYGNLDKYTDQAATGIRLYMTNETRKMHRKYINMERIYYDAYVSRPYVIYRDKENAKVRFENLKRVWNKRNIIIIEGAKTRFGVGNDLLDNASSIQRIIGPATSSFDRYDEILEAALKNAFENVLFLIALGPCAGVVAFDLTKAGYQAIDIGHVDLEYEWYLAGQEARGPVKNKYNNEVPGGNIVEEVELPQVYYEQIIADFS